jgi:hypothetical protein
MAEKQTFTEDKRRSSLPVVVERQDDSTIHVVRRGEEIEDDTSLENEIVGYDAERMRARTLLSEAEEKKLMRRIDWHLMPLCSIMFLLKNMDYQNVCSSGSWNTVCRSLMLEQQAANARIMNKGTPLNILTQLHMSANDYNFISTIYYVSLPRSIDAAKSHQDRSHTLYLRPHPTCSSRKSFLRDGSLA